MFTKICLLGGISFFTSLTALAQDSLAAVQVGSHVVTRGELAYAYKGYLAVDKGKRKTVDGFVQNYIELQQKAMAARNIKLDTVSFIREAMNVQKARLLRPLFLTKEEGESAALKIYTATKNEFGGKPLLKVATIFRYLPQKTSSKKLQDERLLMDSLYNVLLKGGDFFALAKKYSSTDDVMTGYVPAWVTTGTTWRDYESQAYTLKPGEFSKPFLSIRGFYIVKLLEEQPFPSFDAVKSHLLEYMNDKGITLRLVQEKLEAEKKMTRVKKNAKQLKFENETALFSKFPEVRWQLAAYENALLAAEWDKRPDTTAQNLSLTYPVQLHEKVLRTLEKDYAK